MARISVYQPDINITENDKVIGTDFSGSVTKNFPLSAIADLFNKGYTVIGGQSAYKFSNVLDDGTLTGPGNNALFSNISSIRLSAIDAANNNIPDFIQEYSGEKIIVFENSNKNNYGIYSVGSVLEDALNPGYYIFALTAISTHGNISIDKYYSIAMIATSSGSGDKFYTYNQASSQSTWNITHNLGKYPSVSITLSTGQIGYGDVTYIDENNLTVSFSGDVSGKAYLN